MKSLKPLLIAAALVFAAGWAEGDEIQRFGIGDVVSYFERDLGMDNPLKLVDSYKQLIKKIGGIEVRNDTKIELLEKGGAEQGFFKSLAADSYPFIREEEMLEGFEFLLKSQNLVNREFSMNDFNLNRARKNIAGTYDSTTKKLSILKNSKRELIEQTLLHELFHAAQDNIVDLDKLDKNHTSLDEGMVLSAVIEGQAMFFGYFVSLKSKKSGDAVLAAIEKSLNQVEKKISSSGNGDFIQNFFAFPYNHGFLLVAKHFVKTKEFNVKAMLSQIPASSAQALHPEKLASGVKPAKIVIEIDSVLRRGCKNVYSTTLGEYYILSMLHSWRPEESEKNIEASSGWSGDKVMVYKCGDAKFSVWETVWDTEKDAVEFLQRFAEHPDSRKIGYLERPDATEPPKPWTAHSEKRVGVIAGDISDEEANKIFRRLALRN